MAYSILLIDDDASLHQLLGQYLEDVDFQMFHAESGMEGLKLLFDHRPDIILLDVMMPRMDGWETCRRIRELTDVPVIFLTAKSDEPSRLEGFRLGADDFIAKPFSFAELTARVEAVLRRTHKMPASGKAENDSLVCGPFELDHSRRRATKNGEPLELTPTEYKLLETLMTRANTIFTQTQLVTAVWGPEYADDTGYIRRYVWHLRQKIEDDPNHPQHLLTERGFGYRFVG